MKTFLSCLAVLVGVVVLALSLVLYRFWANIPPEVDPTTLPSRGGGLSSTVDPKVIEEGAALARSVTVEEKLPSLSLAVAVAGEIVWQQGLGWADAEAGSPVTPQTRFRIGGISQTLTSAAVGLLVDRGALDLDAPVQSYVTDFPEKRWPVTTRQLMAHTSGVRPHGGEGGIFRGGGCADDRERWTLIAEAPLRFRPDTRVAYSTHGWSLVGAVVAAAAGETYLDFLSREVLAKLGMERTVPDEAGQPAAGSARFYYPSLMLDPFYGLQDAPPVDLSCHLPAVGFLSTPSDLVRFGSAMMSDRLLAPETATELQRSARLRSGEPVGWALGWEELSLPLGTGMAPSRIVGQGLGQPVERRPLSAATVGGQVAGATATLLIVPEHDVAIAVTTNVSGAKYVPVLALELAELFVRDSVAR